MKQTFLFIAIALFLNSGARAQTIRADARVDVRTVERIDTRTVDGRIFHATVDMDVVDTNGVVVLPKGSDAELMVRLVDKHEMTIDLDSVTVNGQRFAVASNEIERKGKKGVGHAIKMIGGGAVLGTVIGAIAGGGAGAAIGAASGAAVGTGAAILTHGKSVKIPAETVLKFRLEQPLTLGTPDPGFNRDGAHYHPYPQDSNPPNQDAPAQPPQ